VGLSYRDSGVDIEKGDAFVDVVKAKLSAHEQGNIGMFGGLFDMQALHYKHPVLVAGADGVGTKLLLAKMSGKYSTIGIDLVAMCVNDVVTSGAKPLFFLDYLATGELEIPVASEILDGIITGCRQAGCTLLGGETAEMPGIYERGDYELAGFSVGIVERERIIDGKSIAAGDVLLGFASRGVHSNGMSLARHALFDIRGYDPHRKFSSLSHNLIEELLTPTRIYVDTVLELLEKIPVHGIAHITGGGLYGNVKRVLPDGLDIRINWEQVRPQPIFDLIQHAGDVNEGEMRRTFNMGIGMVMIVSEEYADRALEHAKGEEDAARVIGTVYARK
jgi:phosphoribosylformylglycinamidine cyclo-ligase